MRFTVPDERVDTCLVGLLLVIGIVAGGGNVTAPLAEYAVVVAAALLLVAHVWYGNPGARRPPVLVAFGLGLLLLHAVQLVPLPPHLWAALPGHALPAAVLSAAGEDAYWRPMSLDPDRTLYSAVALLPVLAMLWIAGGLLAPRSWRTIALVLIASAILSTLLGAMQIGGQGDWRIYAHAHASGATGFFANRNHLACLLVIALAVFMDLRHRTRTGILTIGIAILLVGGVVATASRAGVVLMIGVFVADFARRDRGYAAYRRAAIVIGVALLITGIAAILGSDTPRHLLARFAEPDDARWTIWRTAIEQAKASLPFGSGMGSFAEVYPAFERVDSITPLAINRAHDDYLEWLCEGGILWPLPLVLAATVRGEMRRITSRALSPDRRWAATTLLVIAAHAVVDYPLRTLGIAILAALALARLASPDPVRD